MYNNICVVIAKIVYCHSICTSFPCYSIVDLPSNIQQHFRPMVSALTARERWNGVSTIQKDALPLVSFATVSGPDFHVFQCKVCPDAIVLTAASYFQMKSVLTTTSWNKIPTLNAAMAVNEDSTKVFVNKGIYAGHAIRLCMHAATRVVITNVPNSSSSSSNNNINYRQNVIYARAFTNHRNHVSYNL